ETAACELLRHFLRDRALRRNLLRASEAIDLGFAVDEVPQQVREAGSLVHDVEPGTRREDGAFDLHAIADNALVLHQALDLLGRVARYLLGLEFAEGSPEVVAFAQYGDPGQSGLESVQNKFLIERSIIKFGHAPFVIVVGDVERVELGPRA